MLFKSTVYSFGVFISVAIAVVSAAGCFGWVAPVMNHLLDPKSDLYMTSSQLSWMIVIPEIGDLLVSIPAGTISDKWGRKPIILISGPMLIAGWIVIIFTKSYTVICLVRVLQGVAIGIVFSIVPTYMGEISSPSKRGSITGLFSSAWFLGYLLEYCIGPFVTYSMFTAVTAFVPAIFTAMFSYQPESPYYLLMKGKDTEAEESLAWLRKGNTENEIKSEFEDIKQSVKESMKNKTSLKDVIATPVDRRALFIVLLIGSVRILSGGFAIMSYSTHLFSETAPSSLSPDLLTIVMGFSLFLGGFINTAIVDVLGRRPLIFISSIGSFFCLLAVTIYFYIQTKLYARLSNYSWIVPLAIISYSVFSVVGLYPVSMTYTSELFTTKTRGRAASICSINLTIVSFICIKLYQIVADSFGLFAVFLFYTLVSLIGTVLLYIFAPETKGKSFSQIREELTNILNKKKNTFGKSTSHVIEV